MNIYVRKNKNIHTNKFDKLEKKLINPYSNTYVQNPEYFYFKSKREGYRGMNILTYLQQLKVNSEPFIPKVQKKREKTKNNVPHHEESIYTMKFDNNNKSNNSKRELEVRKEQAEVKVQNDDINNKDKMEQNKIENDKHIEAIDKIKQHINLKEIKEYVPKKFRLVSKDTESNSSKR